MVEYVISSLLGCKYIIRILCHLRVGPGAAGAAAAAAAAAARAGYIPTFESPYFYRQFNSKFHSKSSVFRPRNGPTDNPVTSQGPAVAGPTRGTGGSHRDH